MNKFNAKLSAAVAMAAVIATTLAPAAFADTIVVKGNATDSNNNVTVINSNTTDVTQTNESLIVNGVLTVSNTGLNSANENTGGETNITTGKVVTDVNITNTGSKNEAVLPDCGCPKPDNSVTVKKNGKDSTNTVRIVNRDNKTVTQNNSSAIINLVGTISNTGLNSANENGGGDDPTIKTGKIKTKVNIRNTGSSNILH